MAGTMTQTDIAACDDVDELWDAFVDARGRGDDDLAELLRARMAELQEQRAIRALDDDQLLARIAELHRLEEEGGGIDLNTSPPGPVLRLSALMDEAARRDL